MRLLRTADRQVGDGSSQIRSEHPTEPDCPTAERKLGLRVSWSSPPRRRGHPGRRWIERTFAVGGDERGSKERMSGRWLESPTQEATRFRGRIPTPATRPAKAMNDRPEDAERRRIRPARTRGGFHRSEVRPKSRPGGNGVEGRADQSKSSGNTAITLTAARGFAARSASRRRSSRCGPRRSPGCGSGRDRGSRSEPVPPPRPPWSFHRLPPWG